MKTNTKHTTRSSSATIKTNTMLSDNLTRGNILLTKVKGKTVVKLSKTPRVPKTETWKRLRNRINYNLKKEGFSYNTTTYSYSI